jgi:mannose-6-phosphate isomerase
LTELYPLHLPPSFRERIWGSYDLAPIFGKQEKKIGEAWYSFGDNIIANGPLKGRTLADLIAEYGHELMGEFDPSAPTKNRGSIPTPPAEPLLQSEPQAARSGPSPFFRPPTANTFPILAKLLFTSDRLSVQVHPKDDYAQANEGSPGKTEMWYVVAAEPGATVAIGLTETLSPGELKQAAVSGEIETYLNWVEVQSGQTIFVPAGTLHAIGPGLVLCEIQQNSDVTYRFYDFGRLGADGQPRELHIDKAVEVTEQQPHPGPTEPFRFPDTDRTRELLVACPHFAVEHWSWNRPIPYPDHPSHADLLIFLQGKGTLGDHPYTPGDAYLLPAALDQLELTPKSPTQAIRAYLPNQDPTAEKEARM